MKYIIAAALIVSFIGVGVFGLAISSLYDDGMHGMSDGCFARAINGNLCPKDFLDYVSYHISAFNKFLSAIASRIYDPFFAAVFASLLAFTFFLLDLPKSKPRFSLFKHIKEADLIRYRNRNRFTAWISLLENSPSF